MSNLGIGTDEWVAQHEERQASRHWFEKLFAQTPLWTKWGAFFLIAIALDRKSTRLNSSHSQQSRMPSSA